MVVDSCWGALLESLTVAAEVGGQLFRAQRQAPALNARKNVAPPAEL